MSAIRRVLHASDLSSTSRPAFALACALASRFRVELIVLHAYERVIPAAGPASVLPPRMIDEMWAAARRESQQGVDRLAAVARKAGLRVSTRVEAGGAAAVIVRAAEKARVGLIVLGTHGRSGLRRLALGSVAERVVRTARCPVLTVRPRTRRKR